MPHPADCTEEHVCTRCRESLPCSMYSRRTSTPRAKRQRKGERIPKCRPCCNAIRNQYRVDNPNYNSIYQLAYKFGLTPEGYEAMLAAQGGTCAICHTTDPGGRGRGWQVDHDHACCPGPKTCGQCVRGLLCTSCNTGIGSLRDDPEIMKAAIRYVTR